MLVGGTRWLQTLRALAVVFLSSPTLCNVDCVTGQ